MRHIENNKQDKIIIIIQKKDIYKRDGNTGTTLTNNGLRGKFIGPATEMCEHFLDHHNRRTIVRLLKCLAGLARRAAAFRAVG
jgi:hypothetical protein